MFLAQMDYTFFVYGLAFILLAGICATMRAERYDGLPWVWLGLFGLLHGLHEWMELLELTFGRSSIVARFHPAMLPLSFGSLLEFGRRGTRSSEGKSVGPWVHLPFLAGAAAGMTAGWEGFDVATRYCLALPATAWAAVTMVRASRIADSPLGALRLGAMAMGGYMVAAGVVVPPATFVPASVFNADSFQAFTGIPIQVFRAALAVLVSVAVWRYHRHLRKTANETQELRFRHGLRLALALVLVLLAGWIGTQWVGLHTVVANSGAGLESLPHVIPVAVVRLAPIAVTLLVSVLVVGFFVAHERLWDAREILRRKGEEQKKLIATLQQALAEVKTLRGLLPICANCKKIRDAQGAWVPIEGYIQMRSEAQFSHGLCPDCLEKLYPES
jgi:hypothetical protein